MGVPLMKKRRKNLKAKGFTLIEVMAGVAIFGIALLGMLALMAQSLSMGQFAHNRTIAMNEVRKTLEDIRYTADNSGLSNVNCSQSTAESTLKNETIVVSCPDGSAGDPLHVQGKISWSERGRTVSYVIDAMVTQR